MYIVYSLLAHSSSRYDNHLILPRKAENLKSVTFYMLVKTLKGLSFFASKQVQKNVKLKFHTKVIRWDLLIPWDLWMSF